MASFAQCYSPSNAYDTYAKFHANLTNHSVADTRSQADGRTWFSSSYRMPPGKLNVLGKRLFCSSCHLTGLEISSLEWNPKLITIFTKSHHSGPHPEPAESSSQPHTLSV
jgi:hypothetical protein